MACLGSVLYDPLGAVVTKATTALLAMTAIDITNARITFTAPPNGTVLARIRISQKGASTSPQVLLGVLEGATLRGRQAPLMPSRGVGSTNLIQREVVFPITGLTPGNSYTFDAAYGVETLLAATQLGYGGPNNALSSDAYGAISFEIWETDGLLGAIHYDPTTTAASYSTATLTAMTAIDTTNLRLSGITVPASGRIAARLRGCNSGATSLPAIHLGVMNGSTVLMRQAAWINSGNVGAPAATDLNVAESMGVISGLTPGASLTLDAAMSVETIVALSAMRAGGPNDATANNAFGGFTYELWAA